MTLPAREIPGSGPENMQNMLQLQNHKKLKTSFKYYTERMYQNKTILTSKSHYMQFSKKKKVCYMNSFRVIDEIHILLILNVFMIKDENPC